MMIVKEVVLTGVERRLCGGGGGGYVMEVLKFVL